MYRYIRSDIYYDEEGNLDIDFYNDNHGGLPTYRGKLRKNDSQRSGDPYVTSDKLVNGHSVYSVYPFKGPKYVDILLDIKHGKMDPEYYDIWLRYTAEYINYYILRNNKPDVIAVPESSSSLVVDLARKISLISKIDYLPHAFKKNPVEDIVIDLPDDVKADEATLKKAETLLDKVRKNGKFESKLVPKQWLKFFRNIYTNDDDYIDELYNKKVAVIDDSMTSKATMMNIFDVCDYLYETQEAYGITIFKKVGSK